MQRPSAYRAAVKAHEENPERQRHAHETDGEQKPEELGEEDEAWQVSLPMEQVAPTTGSAQ